MARRARKTYPALVAAEVRQRQAVQLRIEGYTFHEIAQALGYADEATAYNAVSRRLAMDRHEAVEELREVEGKRLEALTRAVWATALTGDPESIRAYLGIAARRARLFGLDEVREVQGAAGAMAVAGVQVLVQIGVGEAKPVEQLTEAELVAYVKHLEIAVDGEKPGR